MEDFREYADVTTAQIEPLMNGGTVVDDKIGKVGQVYLDDESGNPEWVTAKTGIFGGAETFIPLRRGGGRFQRPRPACPPSAPNTTPPRSDNVDRSGGQDTSDPNTDDALAGDALAGGDLSEEEHDMTLSEERVVVDKETVPVERVRMDKDTVTEEQQVSEDVRRSRSTPTRPTAPLDAGTPTGSDRSPTPHDIPKEHLMKIDTRARSSTC